MTNLLFKALCGYLPYNLKCVLTSDLRDDFRDEDYVENIEIFKKGAIWEYAGYADENLMIPLGEGDFSGFLIKHNNTYTCVGKAATPILRPLSDLTKDDILLKFYERFGGGYKEFRSFKKHNSDNLLYTPYTALSHGEVELMQELHIDYLGLIDQKLAININTLEQ